MQTPLSTLPSILIRVQADQIESDNSKWNSITLAPGIYILEKTYSTYRLVVNVAYLSWLSHNEFVYERDLEPTGPVNAEVRVHGQWVARRNADVRFFEDGMMAIKFGCHLTVDSCFRTRAQMRHLLRFEWAILRRDSVNIFLFNYKE